LNNCTNCGEKLEYFFVTLPTGVFCVNCFDVESVKNRRRTGLTSLTEFGLSDTDQVKENRKIMKLEKEEELTVQTEL